MLIWPPFKIHTQNAEADDGNLFGVNKFSFCFDIELQRDEIYSPFPTEAREKEAYHLCKGYIERADYRLLKQQFFHRIHYKLSSVNQYPGGFGPVAQSSCLLLLPHIVER